MKKILGGVAIVAVLAFCGGVQAQLATPVDPFSPDAPVVTKPSNPDHLEPIPAYDRLGYDQVVYQALLGKENAELWMIGKPSFSPEYAVILRHIREFDKSSDPVFPKVTSEKWVIEYVEAKEQIWKSRSLDGARMKLDGEVAKDLVKKMVEVTPEFAGAMHSAWQSVLKKTRYPEIDYRGLDGSTFQFYCSYEFFGEIWTPYNGTPRMITELGHKLIEVTKADGNDREELIEQCLKSAMELRKRTTEPEQEGADQPTSDPESKSEDEEKTKPKPETEGSSQ